MKIIVTGSVGNVSQPLTRELVKRGHTVTVISSRPEKQKDIEVLGASAAIGSLEDVDFLVSVFTGADALFAMVPPNFAEADQAAYYRRIGGHYVQAIQQSGIKRVVHLSSYGAHLDKGTGFIRGSYFVEGMLNALPDVAVTHLRAGYFYYNLYNFMDMIKELGFIGSNYGGHDKLLLVAPADIAAAAAEELSAPAAGQRLRYVVSDEHTASEVAHVLGAAIGKPDLQWKIFTDEQLKNSMEQRGVPAHIIANVVELGASLHSGRLYELHEPIAMGKVKLEDFAKEFAAAFKKGD
ncbi:NmrA family NAD(P)-binding protein [Chitinophaga japonensis]|uniref:Uncharacterized protein YbjT (DUF2867 family) n=1 Tax=Chitinophaga japonensis TaxID=104662 RepID=A0A562TBK8_CHIJA|nr:NAD(P)H-binding protein [Chitinophaga japonensis]TWI90925.1 uncharacterized protein YbjT (DUF2867 family) [Chitinophaga japonensis]